MTVYAIIPARGGSQGLPGKNVRMIAGAPLIAHILRTARTSTEIFRVFVSTENDMIAEVACAEGAEVIRHSPVLSTGARESFGVVKHAVREWTRVCPPEILVMLRATAPLTSSEDIDSAVRLLRDNPQADSVVGVTETFVHPKRVYKISKRGRLVPFDPVHTEQRYPRRRQTFPKVYVRTAGLYVTQPRVVLAGSLWGNVVLPYVIPRERSVNINDELDLKVAEMLLLERT